MKTLEIKWLAPVLSNFRFRNNTLYFDVTYNEPSSIICDNVKTIIGPATETYTATIKYSNGIYLYEDKEYGIKRRFNNLYNLCYEYGYDDYLRTINQLIKKGDKK